MRAPYLIARASALPARELRDAATAAALLAWASLTLKLLPFARAISSASGPVRRQGRKSDVSLEQLVIAVRRASDVVPWRSVCIHQGLALQRFLRSRGFDAVLCYGTAHVDGELKSHVWVKVGDRTVIGGEEAPDYQLLATYPDTAQRP
jgi:hypothetical protein